MEYGKDDEKRKLMGIVNIHQHGAPGHWGAGNDPDDST
jgi:hypothetical protein